MALRLLGGASASPKIRIRPTAATLTAAATTALPTIAANASPKVCFRPGQSRNGRIQEVSRCNYMNGPGKAPCCDARRRENGELKRVRVGHIAAAGQRDGKSLSARESFIRSYLVAVDQ